MPDPGLAVGAELSGFTLEQVAPLPELNATLYRLVHARTGARYLHLATADDNNLFAVGFRTPPRDHTGAPHILEHTVLCGSRRYPVRDPFFSMIKRSLQSFMNALTAADWTLYPFSTQNAKDFDNLLSVYLDAAFFPLLRERDFRQEGWRLEPSDPADPASPLTLKGVVYNEMKGAMADPHSLLSQRVAEALYPTSAYGFNSGGEPAHIPDLTWEGLRAFHAACYHPSNAYFFSYGDLPLQRHLEAVEERALKEFDRAEVRTAVADEVRFGAPRRVAAGFPVEEGEPLEGRAMVQMAWLNGPVTDSLHRVSMNLLTSLLLGTPAAPLYKALLDSKLGANLAPGTGYNDENRETCFEAGLQGTEADRTEAVEEVILATLEKAARDGFSRDRVEAAIHRMEFAHREVRGDHYPYGLSLVSRVMGPWIHGGDPLAALSLSRDLEEIRRRLDAGPYFQHLIRQELLDNPHRVTLTLAPDPSLAAKEEQASAERLASLERGLDDAGRRSIVAEAEALRRAQEAEEDLSCLPTVELADIPPEERPVASRVGSPPVPVRWFDQPTNGIEYVSAYLEAGDLPTELQAYLPLFCGLLPQVGAAGHSYAEMAERIEAATGGVGAAALVLDDPRALGPCRVRLAVKAKALRRNQRPLFEILADLCTAPDFADLDRVATVVGQIRVNLENSIPSMGHRYAARVAAASLSSAGRLRERWGGVEHVRFVREVAALPPEGLAAFSERLGALASQLLARARLTVAVAGEASGFEAVSVPLDGFVAALPAGAPARPAVPEQAAASPCRVGLGAAVPVNYVVRAFPCVPYTHPDGPGLVVLAKLLKASFLHREIRERGGAYGGMASYDPEGGLFTMLSYRDPQLARTLKVYDEAAAWAASGDFGAAELKEAVLGVFSDLDRPLSPSGKAEREFASLEQGLTPEMRQTFREGLLAATRDQLADLSRRYLVEGRARSAVAVVASEEALKRGNAELGEEALALERL